MQAGGLARQLPNALNAMVVSRLVKRIKRQILQEAAMPDACFSDVARRYGIAERVLFRWKDEANQAASQGAFTSGDPHNDELRL